MTTPVVSIASVLVVVLLVLAVATFLFLVVLRLGMEAFERRDASRREVIREEILEVVLGEPDERQVARAALVARSGSSWDLTEDQAFRMLPKVKGDAQGALVDLLLAHRAESRANRLLGSSSQVRRSRGAHRLGLLGRKESLSLLVARLDDRALSVRRNALRALGNIGAAEAIGPMIAAGTADPALRHDLGYALDRIGPAAAPGLREIVDARADSTDPTERRAIAAATALGRIGDLRAVPVLIRAVTAPAPALRVAAVEALGEIGTPEAVGALEAAVGSADARLRIAAAVALGRIGTTTAVGGLSRALASPVREVARAAAKGLLGLHGEGRRALALSPSPYAVEALAIDAIRRQRG